MSFRDFWRDSQPKIAEFDNAIATSDRQGVKGGIYDDRHKLVATMDRQAQNQNFALNADFEADFVDESVIFGGMSIPHFGHLMLEGFSRLWYLLENPQDERKIIYMSDRTWSESAKHTVYSFFELLNVDKSRVLIVEKPTKFAHISVPEISFGAWSFYTKGYQKLCERFMQNANTLLCGKKSYEKIYLSHTKWNKNQPFHRFLNEDIYEKFFAQKGFKVLYPEEFSVSEMVYYVSNATQIATTMGSLSHYGLFARRGTRFMVITSEANARSLSNGFAALTPQCVIHQMKELDWFIIDANLNFLPSFDLYSGWGAVNFYFTQDFIDFANDYLGGFDPKFDYQKDPLDYIKAWVRVCADPKHYEKILSNLTPFDFLNKASEVLLGETLDVAKYQKPLTGDKGADLGKKGYRR